MSHGEQLPRDAVQHARQCAECGAFLDRSLASERALENATGLSERALSEVETALMAGLPPPPNPRRNWFKWTLAVPLLGAAAGVFLFLAPGGQYSPRGDSVPGGVNIPHVRLMCIGADAVKGEGRSDQPAAAPMRCGLQDTLTLSASLPAEANQRYVFVVGRTVDGEPRWYRPRPEQGQSLLVPDGAVSDAALAAIKLRVNHQAGPLTVVAIFSSRPLDLADVRERLKAPDVADVGGTDTLVQRVEVVLE